MNASTKKFTLPDRNVFAGGLSGLAVFAISMLLKYAFDMEVDGELIAALIAIVVPTVSYMVPPSITDFLQRLNAVIREAAYNPATPPADEVLEAGEKVAAAVSQAKQFETLKRT